MTYIPNIADTNRQASAVAFLESMQSKIELLMKAGDAADHQKAPTNKAVVDCPKKEKKFLALAMKRRAQGLSWTKAAEGTPWNADTLRALAIRRGQYVAPDRAREQRLKQAKLNAIAKKVNSEARKLGTLKKALAKHPEITEDQYHAARARLNLPHIARRKP